jgi:hypothetical protein
LIVEQPHYISPDLVDFRGIKSILDNHVVAMTGHQPTPGSGKNLFGEETKVIKLEDIAKSLGIEKVKVVDPYDVKGTTKAIREIMDYHGPSVIIAQRPCPLLIERGPAREVLKECNSCGVCIWNTVAWGRGDARVAASGGTLLVGHRIGNFPGGHGKTDHETAQSGEGFQPEVHGFRPERRYAHAPGFE